MQDFNDIRHNAKRLFDLHAERNRMFDDILRMFTLDSQEGMTADWIKNTLSPGPFNDLMGATRLMVSTEPQISVPKDEGGGGGDRVLEDKLENAGKGMWNGAGRVIGRPIHYDMVHSGFLFAEICASVMKTAEHVKYAEESKDTGSIARWQSIARKTPYLFATYDPRTCYPDRDTFGLRGMYRQVRTTWGQVLSIWGAAAEAVKEGKPDRHQEVTYCDWWDWGERCAWLEGGSQPIYHDEHGLGFLPFVDIITEGNGMFAKPQEQRYPLLYPLWKSGLWKRQNLSLTMAYSMIFAVGMSPLYKRKGAEPGAPLRIEKDPNLAFNYIDLEGDEDITLLAEKVVDPNLWAGLDRALGLQEQSTISRMALGAPPDQAMAYSAITLLAQSGRLPLIGVKTGAGNAVAELLTGALNWYKRDGAKEKMYRRGRLIELDPSEIPDEVVLEVNMEPDLPQDKLQMARVAVELVNNQLTSREWARENVLGIGQASQMDKTIYDEKAMDNEAAKLINPPPPPPTQQGAPPEMSGAIPPGGIQPGNPMTGPAPSMMEGGQNGY